MDCSFREKKTQLKKAFFFSLSSEFCIEYITFFPGNAFSRAAPSLQIWKMGQINVFLISSSLSMHNKCAQFALPHVSHPDNLMAAKKGIPKALTFVSCGKKGAFSANYSILLHRPVCLIHANRSANRIASHRSQMR